MTNYDGLIRRLRSNNCEEWQIAADVIGRQQYRVEVLEAQLANSKTV